MSAIELWTYGFYEKENDVDFGLCFAVPKSWLVTKVKSMGFSSLVIFLNEYTWDISKEIYLDSERQGITLSKKSGNFGHDV